MKQTRQLTLTIIAAIALAAATVPTAYGQTAWNAVGGDRNWNTASNWNPANVPNTTTEIAAFNNTGVGTVNLNIAGTTAISALQNGVGFAGTWTLDLNGNTLTTLASTSGERLNVGFNVSSPGTFNITNGTFTTQGGFMRVGVGTSANSVGNLNISAGIGTTVANMSAMQIGYSAGGVSATGTVAYTGTGELRVIAAAVDRINIGAASAATSVNAIGTLTLGANLSSAYFQNTVPMRIGTVAIATYNNTVEGRLISSTATTLGESSAQLQQLLVGHSTSSAGSGTAYGLLDLGNAPSVSAFIAGTPVSGTPTMQVGVGRNATGEVILPEGTFTVRSGNSTVYSMQIGDNTTGNGTVTLNGTQLVLDHSHATAGNRRGLQINNGGHLINNITDTSSGATIDIADSPTTAFSIASFALGGVGMTLNFDDPNFTPTPTNPYWGFRWRGSFVSDLTAYVNEPGSTFISGDGRIDVNIVGGSNLQWSDFNIGTYSDGGITYTYIGFTDFEAPLVLVPEPSTVFLLLVGGGLLYRRWGRNAK